MVYEVIARNKEIKARWEVIKRSPLDKQNPWDTKSVNLIHMHIWPKLEEKEEIQLFLQIKQNLDTEGY